MEVDIDRGVSLVRSAAEAELPEAMKKLYKMYLNGDRVDLDYHESLKWIQRLYDYHVREYGEEHPDTLKVLNNLGTSYTDIGEYHKSIEIYEKLYALNCKVFGDEHPNTAHSVLNLSYAYGNIGDLKKEFDLCLKANQLSSKIPGKNFYDISIFSTRLAQIAVKIGFASLASG